ncbi:MAG: hypothetical protein FWG31_06575 [Oscillospiraceae bacterium]|nr:hypothetical protein [Oscillospiraceae bacterium]
MARMDCICGEYLSNSLAPNDIQLRVYTDKEWDAILEQDVIESWKFPLPTYDVWRCPKCKRIHAFLDGPDKLATVYIIEEKQ